MCSRYVEDGFDRSCEDGCLAIAVCSAQLTSACDGMTALPSIIDTNYQ